MTQEKKMIFFFLVLGQLRPDTNDIDPLPLSLIRARHYLKADMRPLKLIWENYYDYVWALDNAPVLERSRQVDKYRRMETQNNISYYQEKLRLLRFNYIKRKPFSK
jgi:hypothetical protein